MEQQTWTPERILQTTGAYWATCALQGAVALDVFSLIGDDQINGEAVARELDAPADAVARLLDALAAMGLLVKSTDGYANTDASRIHLCKDSEHYLGYIIQHHHHLVASWARLPEAVRTGMPIRKLVRAEAAREAFLMGMFNLAMQLAPQLVPAVDLSGRRRLLDLGGGPGTYAIHFCKRYPELAATVVDLDTTRPFAEKTIRRLGMEKRVSFLAADYLKDEIPGSFDVVWMSHILHAESEDDCRHIVAKTFECLNPGGLVIIHEFILNDSLDGPLFPALFSLNMLLGTDGGRAYSQSQLSGMLTLAGFADVQRLAFTGPNDSGLIRAVKPA